ncbi:hypothetical protein [Candidatus Nephthysia bennettiae]|uniref:Uncharacterized protein n=1 Tax=Candidatus Nephthysia bennettiae TaxID=3127016 RepID=A0A934K711_9BACT|nr:hypothetical protein [Candidatus Dormibacteraeota bacterium]MBJ7607707.1 hypothetical protein [Candidatus Dormibacteraeota bacterium]MBJ7612598.1 hypothetical protein [Candidatus Dormibacteraeota bacterium]
MAHETNLARAPIWGTDLPRPDPQATVVLPNLYGQAVHHVEGPALTFSDERLMAEFTTDWMRDGCRVERRIVEFSENAACRALGYSQTGGRQRTLVKKALRRLRSSTFEFTGRHPDGSFERRGWGMLNDYYLRSWSEGRGVGWVEISEPIARLLAEGSFTYLHQPTWDELRQDDDLAARLWVFLEAEELGEGRRYSVFRPEGVEADGDARQLPTIGELLGVETWALRKKAADRLRRACRQLMTADPRYVLSVVSSRDHGMWRLEARRRRLTP